MRRLLFIIQKEFIQIFRNKAILPMMTIAPIVQLIVLSFAANNEVKNVNLAIVDHDHSSYSRLLIGKVQASDRFSIVAAPPSAKRGDAWLQNGRADVVLIIPPDFEKDFLKEKKRCPATTCQCHQWITGNGRVGVSDQHHSIFQSRNPDGSDAPVCGSAHQFIPPH